MCEGASEQSQDLKKLYLARRDRAPRFINSKNAFLKKNCPLFFPFKLRL